MTPEEKAKELVCRYYFDETILYEELDWNQSKLCALIMCNELIRHSEEWDDSEYWEEVKQEIEKL